MISLFGYLIYRNLNKLEEIKYNIYRKNKEIEYENKIKLDLKENIKNINKDLDESEQKANIVNNLYENKKSEFEIILEI